MGACLGCMLWGKAGGRMSKEVGGAASARAWLGLGIGVAAAFMFALSVSLAREVYAAGGTPQAIIGVRLTLVFFGLLAFALLFRRPMRLEPKPRTIACALGVLLCFQTLSIYASFLYIPISLSILIEYLYPLLVALLMWVVAREPLTPVKLGAIAVALLGLALILRVSWGTLDPFGMGLAVFSAVALSFMIVTTNQVLKGADSLRLMLHMQPCGAAVGLLTFHLTDTFVLPTTEWGLICLIGIAVLNGSALFSMFSALPMTGPTRTALALTAEPIFVVGLAAALHGESLTLIQGVGGALIVGAIFAMQIWGTRRR
ncbi:MAG: DMT family transporter [Alphaproteobacteria bacterium]|nr:DMT family transporter [Alphaproteobacteria bacterium]